MIEEPGWRSGRTISARPVRGAGAHPAQIVGDLGEADRDGAQLAAGLHQPVAGALGLEVVAGLGQRQSGGAGDLGDHGAGEAGRGVDAGAHGRAAQREFGEAGQRGAQPFHAVTDLGGVAAELLAEGDGRGVHQVGAARLDDVGELLGLALQRLGEVLQGRHQIAGDRGGGRDVDGGGEDVVGGLACVDVVVGVHGAAQALARQGGDDLVGVHVGRGAGAGLEDVDGEVLVPPPLDDLGRGRRDRLGNIAVEHAQLGVGLRRGALDPGQRLDVRALQTLAADGEVLHGPLGLGPPLGVRGDAHLTHGVVLDPVLPVLGHRSLPPDKQSVCLVHRVPKRHYRLVNTAGNN
ncbi:hypothetical protein GCM10020000_29160 [Streptomyces olivoverticillatus]